MGLAPLADAVDIDRASEVVAVLRLVRPATLAGGLTGLAAFRFGTVFLMPEIAIVGKKKDPAVLALTLANGTNHGPNPPWADDPDFGAERGRKEEGKDAGRRQKNGLKWKVWEEEGGGRKLHLHAANSMTDSDHR
jgi:hypothetical protein